MWKNRLLSSIDKAKKILDYKPQTSFEEGVKKLHDWFVDNWENIQESAEFLENKKQKWEHATAQKTQGAIA